MGVLVSGETRSVALSPQKDVPATLRWSNRSHSLLALIDSGADESCLDARLVQELGIETVVLPNAIVAWALDGRRVAKITHKTVPVTLVLSGNHSESICFFVICAPRSPLVLGRPWLRLHNPRVDWLTGQVAEWSVDCHARCLRSALTPEGGAPGSAKRAVSELSMVPALSEVPELSKVPELYHDLAAVFSKEKALSLPPHRPYDCAIELLPGASLPASRLYNLSLPERKSMETYIRESLAAGIIRTSSSPVAAGFFFVPKKDRTLRPCIDFRGLNKITVRNRYPLPLIDSAFGAINQATVFSKLDLRNAYHLVRIRQGDEWKTAFNTPLGHFEYLVMPFGLTNAPAVFQALINDVLRDMLDRFVFVYLDDILIFSSSLEEHQGHVRQVLQRLLENRLFVKAEKCDFHVSSVGFLGYVIGGGTVGGRSS